jgi:RimJ/RimL family protein N-acetyltransferase
LGEKDGPVKVRLRRLREADLPPLIRVRIQEAEDMAFPSLPRRDLESVMRERVKHSGEFHAGEILMGIETEGRLIGEIQARQPQHALPPGVFELGIDIFEESDRGRGLGSEALTQMVKNLFAEQGAHRVQATTDVDNHRMRRVLERLGFVFEGILRGFMPSRTGPRDYALYAITTADLGRTTWTRTS